MLTGNILYQFKDINQHNAVFLFLKKNSPPILFYFQINKMIQSDNILTTIKWSFMVHSILTVGELYPIHKSEAEISQLRGELDNIIPGGKVRTTV